MYQVLYRTCAVIVLLIKSFGDVLLAVSIVVCFKLSISDVFADRRRRKSVDKTIFSTKKNYWELKRGVSVGFWI